MNDRYVFLTGATGLLGSYLLRDLLRADRRCAVVVRPTRFESAVQRIESILARFEREDGRTLPRPVVFEGDLFSPGLGLHGGQLDWVRRHCDTMLHNAASLSFELDEKTNEPYRSNVDGTRNVLEFCRENGIRRFHHVSTAYVCGLRTDLCRESELDVGQEFGNDYERSKVQAEKLVRGAGFLDSLTVYRPSIIVGDSQTGYTSTFHGFYTPLKIVHSFIRSEVIDGTPLLGVIGMTGNERKHFVPVDWVSEATIRILDDPRLHDRTYHLVPARTVTARTTLRVFEDALRRFFKLHSSPTSVTNSISEFNSSMIGEIFREQMEVYKAYWRDDPDFDRTNIEAALPDDPCPFVSYAVLIKLARYALESGFGWPKPQPIKPESWIESALPLTCPGNGTERHCFGLQVDGRGGGGWTFSYDTASNRIVRGTPGLPLDDASLIYMNADTFRRLLGKDVSFSTALRNGAVHIENPSGIDESFFESLLCQS